MGGGEGNVEEKGRVDCGLRGDEVLGLATEGVEYVDVFEVFSRRPTSVEGAPAFLRCHIANPLVIVDERVGKHVERAGQNKTLVKSIVTWANLKGLGEVGVGDVLNAAITGCHLCAEVPLANVARCEASLLQHPSEGELCGGELQAKEAPGAPLGWWGKPQGISTSHDRRAAGYADGVGHVGVGELHPLGAECIEVRRVDIAEIAPECLDVAVAKVICQDEDDVWSLDSRCV